MLLMSPSAMTTADHVGAAAIVVESEQWRASRLSDDSSALRQTYEELPIGRTTYRFRRPIRVSIVPMSSGDFEAFDEVLGSRFAVSGTSYEDASRNWRDYLHVTFQVLLGQRPFEMNAEEREKWYLLESAIDVPHYLRTTPIEERRIGFVSRARPVPSRITWSDKSRDSVTLDQMPANFAAFCPGQWFEALAVRDRYSGRLIRVDHAQPIREICTLGASERDSLLASLPTTDDLPRSRRDWTKE
jgi:hypothetical protein